MALGARDSSVVWLVIRRTLMLGTTGVAIGTTVAWLATRLLKTVPVRDHADRSGDVRGRCGDGIRRRVARRRHSGAPRHTRRPVGRAAARIGNRNCQGSRPKLPQRFAPSGSTRES